MCYDSMKSNVPREKETVIMGIFSKFFKSYSEKQIKAITPLADKVEALAEKYAAMSDEELRAMTPFFREQLAADQAALEAKRGESDGLLYELEQKAEEFEILMAESEVLQEELMQEIAQMEVKLEDAKYDEYLAKLALQGENPPSDASWVMPVSGRLTSPFGMRKHPVLGIVRMHNGIDLAAAQGTPIYATRAGKVTRTSYQAGGAGNYVSINHLDGFSSIYMHMTHYVVSQGQDVSQGQLIGYVGSTGISTGPHLHFGISYAGTYVNPLAYVY